MHGPMNAKSSKSDLFSQTQHQLHVSVLVNHFQASTSHMDMAHLVSAYIMGSRIVNKSVFF